MLRAHLVLSVRTTAFYRLSLLLSCFTAKLDKKKRSSLTGIHLEPKAQQQLCRDAELAVVSRRVVDEPLRCNARWCTACSSCWRRAAHWILAYLRCAALELHATLGSMPPSPFPPSCIQLMKHRQYMISSDHKHRACGRLTSSTNLSGIKQSHVSDNISRSTSKQTNDPQLNLHPRCCSGCSLASFQIGYVATRPYMSSLYSKTHFTSLNLL